MLKLFAIFIVVVIGCFGVSGLSCSSCGSECATACGTRRFRTCCFNYLRRKRGQEVIKMNVPNGIQEEFDEHEAYPLPEERELWWRTERGSSEYDQ